MPEHLVCGDPHANPEYSNDRFDWLGNIILDRRPDVVILMGDNGDFPSLSSYDRGKKDFEGRRYSADVDATNDALARIVGPLRRFNEQARANKKALYRPRLVALGGNHDEGRIDRLVQLHPEFEGVFGIEQILYSDYGFEYVPYETPVCIDGVWYCHHFPTGVSGEAISGVNLAASLIAKNMVSSTVGHSHVLDISNRSRPDGSRVWGLSAGCYFDYDMKYAKATQPRFWWAGVVYKHNVHDGDYEPEMISIKEIERRYA